MHRMKKGRSRSPSECRDDHSAGNSSEDTSLSSRTIHKSLDRRKQRSPSPSTCSYSDRSQGKDTNSKISEFTLTSEPRGPKATDHGRKRSPSSSECSDSKKGGKEPRSSPRRKKKERCKETVVAEGNTYTMEREESIPIDPTPKHVEESAMRNDADTDYDVCDLFAKRLSQTDISICDVSTGVGSSALNDSQVTGTSVRSRPKSPSTPSQVTGTSVRSRPKSPSTPNTMEKEGGRSGDLSSNSSLASLLMLPMRVRTNAIDVEHDDVTRVCSSSTTGSGRPSLLTVPRRIRSNTVEAKLKAELTEVGQKNLQATLQALDFVFFATK